MLFFCFSFIIDYSFTSDMLICFMSDEPDALIRRDFGVSNVRFLRVIPDA